MTDHPTPSPARASGALLTREAYDAPVEERELVRAARGSRALEVLSINAAAGGGR